MDEMMSACSKCGMDRGHKTTCPLRPRLVVPIDRPTPVEGWARTQPIIPPAPETPYGFFTRVLIWFLNLLPHVTILREGGRPYLTRWCLLGGSPNDTNHPFLPFNLFLHCFHASDDTTPHNHPWPWGKSRILTGTYLEFRLLNARELIAGLTKSSVWVRFRFRRGDVNRLDDRMFHHVQIQTHRVWTLFSCPRKDPDRKWGFLVGDEKTGYRFETAREHLSKKPGASSNERIIDD